MTLAMASRDPAIDAARALLMLYVVSYLHLGGYVGDGQTHTGWASVAITQGVLGGFTFLSGYLLGLKPMTLDLASIGQYFRRRFMRVYPLFVLALLGFVLVGLTDGRTALRSLLGLSMFWGEPPMTLWYVVMLLVCYAFAPLLISGSAGRSLIVSLGVLLVLAAWHLVWRPIDLRMATQFAAFAAGIQVARRGWRRAAVWPWLLPLSVAALALQLATTLDHRLMAWTAIPAVGLLPLLLLRGLDGLPQTWLARPAIAWLSNASFCAYLLHRLVYDRLERYIHPLNDAQHWAWLLGLGLPLTLLLAAWTQTAYDRLFTRYSRPARG